jgi:hypothetical protein
MSTRISLVCLLVSLVSLARAPGAYAQTDEPRLELGGQLAALRLNDVDGTTNAGLGGRVSYEICRWLTAEAEMNFFANDDFEARLSPTTFPDVRLGYSRRRLEGVFGPKAGWRGERFGVFGKVRPGFSRLFDKGIECVSDLCALILLVRPQYRTEFAVDVGAVLEYYPTARTVTRVDLGSTIIRHRSVAPPCRDCTSSNFTSRIGVGFRF